MMRVRFFLLIIIFTENLSGQCPERFSYWKQLQNVYTLSYDKQIPAYLNLEKIGINCKLNNDSTFANVLFGLGGMYYFTKNKTQAFLAINQAIRINLYNPSRTSKRTLAKYYYYLGYFQHQENDYQNSIKSFKLCLEISEKYNIDEFALSSYQTLAVILYNLGDYEKEIYYADLGLGIAKTLKSNLYLYGLNFEKSKAYTQLNDYNQAVKHIELALFYARKYNNDVYLGYCYFWRGNVYGLNKDKYPEAITSFSKAIPIFTKLKDSTNLSYTYTSLGYFYSHNLKNYDEGLKISELSLKYCKIPNEQCLILSNIGKMFSLKKDYKKSLLTYQKALNTFPFSFKNTSILENPDVSHLKVADNKEYVFSTLKDKADTWLDFYKATKNKSHLQNALNTYRTADRMIDIMRWEQTGEQSKLFWRKKTRSIYENAIEACQLLGKAEESFYFFEKSRAVLLNDRLKELGAKQLLSANDQKQGTERQQKVEEFRKKVNEAKTNTDENQRALLNAENAQSNFIQQIEARNPAYFRYKYDTATVNIAALRKHLKDQTLVEYFVGDKATYAFVLTQAGMSLRKFEHQDFSSLSANILQLIANENVLNKQYSQYLSLTNQFYKQFIAPLALPKGRVIVSPDGVILPMSALSTSPTRGDWLVRDYAFSYTYSAKFLNQEKRTVATKSFIGIAPVRFAGNQLKLTDSDVSLQRIAERFSSPQLFLNQKATRKAFLDNIGNFQVVQLYTHAIANDTIAQLYLADSTLKASELSTKQLLPTELVVLSACETGIGKEAKGEGIFSLARSFAALGIPSTLTTLWKVDNQATYTITELFYQYLDEGDPKDVALQKAQDEYLSKNTASLSTPNFWAGYVLLGDNTPLERNKWIVLWILGGILIGGIGFWRFKKR